MKNIEKLNQYLNKYFPNLKLCKPLFYNAEIGVRFEIGNPDLDINDKHYIDGVCLRSLLLFEEIFSEDNNILLVVNTHQSTDAEFEITDGVDVFQTYLTNPSDFNKEVDSEVIPFVYLEEDEIDEDSLKTIRYCYECNLGKVKYKEILKAIGNQDLGYKPAIVEEVYFINTDRNIIYHLYDDRGLDVVSNDKDSLENLYFKYNNWILDNDRERINKLFKS